MLTRELHIRYSSSIFSTKLLHSIQIFFLLKTYKYSQNEQIISFYFVLFSPYFVQTSNPVLTVFSTSFQRSNRCKDDRPSVARADSQSAARDERPGINLLLIRIFKFLSEITHRVCFGFT